MPLAKSALARRTLVALTGLLLATFAACSGDEPSSSKRSAEISVPDRPLSGNTVTVQTRLHGLTLAKAGEAKPGTGHVDLFIDRGPNKTGRVVHMTAERRRVFGLSVGRHRIEAVPVDGEHKELDAAVGVAEVEIRGPSVVGNAAPSVQDSGMPFDVRATVLGAEVGGKPGQRRLNFIVDGELPSPGTVVAAAPGVYSQAEPRLTPNPPIRFDRLPWRDNPDVRWVRTPDRALAVATGC